MTTAFPINQIHEIREYQLPVYWTCKPASHMMVGHFPPDVSTSLEYNGWKISNEIHGDLSSKYDYVWWSDMMIKYDYEEHIKQIWWSNNGIFIRQNWRSELSDELGKLPSGTIWMGRQTSSAFSILTRVAGKCVEHILCTCKPDYTLHTVYVRSNRYSTTYILVGRLEHVFFFHILGISSSQPTFTPSFFRGVGLNHQPVIFGMCILGVNSINP